MKISILLPYKENFSPEYPGAVSLFVYETTKISKFKKFVLKAKISNHEINILRGIVRQINWFLNNSKSR